MRNWPPTWDFRSNKWGGLGTIRVAPVAVKLPIVHYCYLAVIRGLPLTLSDRLIRFLVWLRDFPMLAGVRLLDRATGPGPETGDNRDAVVQGGSVA